VGGKNKMKILHVVPYFYPSWSYGGPPRAVYEIAKQQVSLGHEVHVLTTTAFKESEELPVGSLTIDGIKVTRLKNMSNLLMWKFHFCTPIGVNSFLKQNEFDSVHLHEVRTLLNFSVLKHIEKVKIFLSPWGTLPYNNSMIPIKKTMDMFLLPLLRSKNITSFAQTEHEKTTIHSFDIGSEVELVPLGINFEDFKRNPSKTDAKNLLGLKDSNFHYLFLGRFSPYKGLDTLLESFALVRKKKINSKLILVGRDDGYLERLKEKISLLKLSDDVMIFPPMYENDRLTAYIAADGFVFAPTVYEETGTVCLESLACGTPVLITKEADIPFLSDEDGVLRSENRTPPIAESMIRMYDERPLFVDNKKLREHFSWANIAKKYVSVYKERPDAK